VEESKAKERLETSDDLDQTALRPRRRMDPLVQAAGGAGRGGGQEGVVNGPVGEHAGEQNAVGALRRLDSNKDGISRSHPLHTIDKL
jgi:hypothetical protein